MSSLFGIGGGGNVGAAGGSFYDYSIDQSLRFNEGDSPVLSRTQTSGTTTTWTFSAWIKRSRLDSSLQSGGSAGQDPIFCVGENNTNDVIMYFQQYGGGAVDCLDIIIRDGGAIRARFVTSRIFRDTSAWYNIQLTCDFTNSTQGDRLRLYVNGVRETAFGTETYPSDASQITIVNNSSYTARIGQLRADSAYFAGYMAEMHLVDGSALEPTSFGEFKGGVWTCKNYSGSHGTAGWYLPFDDSSAIGDDESANTNDFSVSGLTASDVVLDSPTNNFATMNPIYHSGVSGDLLEGNLKLDGGGFSNTANGYGAVSTFAIPKDKKIYIEVECTDQTGDLWVAGFATQSGLESGPSSTTVGGSNAITVYNRSVMLNGSENDYGSSAGLGGLGVAKMAAGDILGMAIDGATGKVWFSRNGTYFKSPTTSTTGDPAGGNHEIGTITGGTTEDVFVVLSANGSTNDLFVNFGQDSVNVSSAAADANGLGTFEYAPPTDYVCLCSSSLSEPTISPNSTEQADDYFNTVLWSGDGSSSNAITGVGFQPDAVWLKGRNVTYDHQFFNSVTGATKFLKTNTTGSEITSATSLLSFDSDGFAYGSNLSGNQSGKTYVAWNWKAGGTAVSNSAGSITSQVSAAPDAGFSVVTWVGNNTDGATVGHGLTDPEFSIVKNRDSGTNWDVCWSGFTSGTSLNLDTTAAEFSPTTGYQQLGTSTITLKNGGSGIGRVNGTPDDYVAYVFKSVPGYQTVSSYVGNGSSDGTFVYTGHRVRFLLLKIASATNNWFIYDDKREGYNQENDTLSPNDTSAEDNSYKIDLLSNGFKIRGSQNAHNQSGQTFIYLAIGDSFKYANAR